MTHHKRFTIGIPTSTASAMAADEEAEDQCPVYIGVELGLNRFTMEFAVVLLLLLLHVTMILFLVVRGRRDPAFRQAFFVFFVAITTTDCVLMTVSFSLE